MNINELKQLWRKTDFHPNRSLGQNFLIDKNVRDKIIHAVTFDSAPQILEIGPGFGVMSLLLADNCKRLIAVEKDRKIHNAVAPLFREKGNIDLVCSDVLEADLRDIVKRGAKITVFGNIPYYISTPILEKIIDERRFVKDVFLVMQDEFASRVAAGPGTKKYGSLSCFVQFYGKVKKLFKISKNSFYPRPKVDSALLRIDILDQPGCKVKSPQLMFKIIRKAFSQRRKKAINPLSDGKDALKTRDQWIEIFEHCSIDPSIRAERLSLNDYARISDAAGELNH